MKTYFLAKYALTRGIQQVKAAPSTDGYVYLPSGIYKLGRDVFETHADALAAAHAKRVKKIASLRKQLQSLETMTFGSKLQNRDD